MLQLISLEPSNQTDMIHPSQIGRRRRYPSCRSRAGRTTRIHPFWLLPLRIRCRNSHRLDYSSDQSQGPAYQTRRPTASARSPVQFLGETTDVRPAFGIYPFLRRNDRLVHPITRSDRYAIVSGREGCADRQVLLRSSHERNIRNFTD